MLRSGVDAYGSGRRGEKDQGWVMDMDSGLALESLPTE